MARLIYSAICSLDGFVEDEDGRFDWGAPDAQVMAFLNDLERPIGTYLYGRRMYETMVFWETAPTDADQEATDVDFTHLWRAAEKVVYSTTLPSVSTARTRLEREFRPDDVRALKDAADRDLTVGGADLAAHAFAAGLVDQVQLYLVPVVVGRGKRALPEHQRLSLTLREAQRFDSGVLFAAYDVG